MSDKVLDRVLQDVQTRLAALAQRTGAPNVAPNKSDLNLLKTFFDNGVLKVATASGTIRNESELTGSEEDGALPDNMDPATDDALDELVPMDLETAVVYWVLHEWLSSIGQLQLGQFYFDKYRTELATHRFGLIRSGDARRPYRPLG